MAILLLLALTRRGSLRQHWRRGCRRIRRIGGENLVEDLKRLDNSLGYKIFEERHSLAPCDFDLKISLLEQNFAHGKCSAMRNGGHLNSAIIAIARDITREIQPLPYKLQQRP